jgi:hypothetical protein
MPDPIEALLAGYSSEVPVRLVIQRGEQVSFLRLSTILRFLIQKSGWQ